MIRVSIYDGSQDPAPYPYYSEECKSEREARAVAARELGHKSLRGASASGGSMTILRIEIPYDAPDVVTIEPGKCNGVPCVRGLRIPVVTVLDHVASGYTAAQIVDLYPDLNERDVAGCVRFAADLVRQIRSTGGSA